MNIWMSLSRLGSAEAAISKKRMGQNVPDSWGAADIIVTAVG
jgi:hypothetical protein